ncbi:hypothetical protein RFI_06018, partial [Reticulomyxa filosa]
DLWIYFKLNTDFLKKCYCYCFSKKKKKKGLASNYDNMHLTHSQSTSQMGSASPNGLGSLSAETPPILCGSNNNDNNNNNNNNNNSNNNSSKHSNGSILGCGALKELSLNVDTNSNLDVNLDFYGGHYEHIHDNSAQVHGNASCFSFANHSIFCHENANAVAVESTQESFSPLPIESELEQEEDIKEGFLDIKVPSTTTLDLPKLHFQMEPLPPLEPI